MKCDGPVYGYVKGENSISLVNVIMIESPPPMKCAYLLRLKQEFSAPFSAMRGNTLVLCKEDLIAECWRYEGPLLVFGSAGEHGYSLRPADDRYRLT